MENKRQSKLGVPGSMRASTAIVVVTLKAAPAQAPRSPVHSSETAGRVARALVAGARARDTRHERERKRHTGTSEREETRDTRHEREREQATRHEARDRGR